MEQSLFLDYVKKFFKAVTLRLTTFINDKEGGVQTYLFMEMLDKQFSASLKWNTLSIRGRSVMADVVALDANFPLKKRGSIAQAEGDIPKIATKRSLNETQMTEIIQLKNTPNVDYSVQIAQILFDDTKSVVKGVWERLEYFFLQGLSTGIFAIDADNNVGLHEIRVDLRQPDENKFDAAVPWSNPLAKPIDDIDRITQDIKDRGKRPATVMMMNTATWNVFKNNTQVKEQYAGYLRYPVTTNLPIPKLDGINEFLLSEYGVVIRKVDRSVVFEKNGIETTLKCWADNMVAFLPAIKVGKLFYGTLAAEVFVDKTKESQKVDDYILVQKYSDKGDTPTEMTSSQARVIPIPDMWDVMLLNSEGGENVDPGIQTEGDEYITIYGETDVLRVNLINALRNLGVTVNDDVTDVELVKKVNRLNDAKEEQLKFALEIPIVSAGADQPSVVTSTATLTGTATAATGKTIASVLWTKVSGPAGGAITSPTSLSTGLTALQDGAYVYKLTATDSSGTVSSDTVTVTVNVP